MGAASDSSRGESRLTVWLPLTDATLENGCMYLIPVISCQTICGAEVLGSAGRGRDACNNWVDYCQATRAAIARRPALYLGWNHQLISHWGGLERGHVEPRISFAVEFVKSDAELRPDEAPLFDPLTAMPPFSRSVFGAISKGLPDGTNSNRAIEQEVCRELEAACSCSPV